MRHGLTILYIALSMTLPLLSGIDTPPQITFKYPIDAYNKHTPQRPIEFLISGNNFTPTPSLAK